jgi:hypothetical protein
MTAAGGGYQGLSVVRQPYPKDLVLAIQSVR